MLILAIDPGDVQSGFCMMCENYSPVLFGKEDNNELLKKVMEMQYDVLVCEMIQSMGMAVGRTVFETCVWIGRFEQAASVRGIPTRRVFRREEKLNLCGSSQAKDANIRQALIDRFAKTPNGKGTKKEPDFFYGFSDDAWMAFGVGTCLIDREKRDAFYGKMVQEALE